MSFLSLHKIWYPLETSCSSFLVGSVGNIPKGQYPEYLLDMMMNTVSGLQVIQFHNFIFVLVIIFFIFIRLQHDVKHEEQDILERVR